VAAATIPDNNYKLKRSISAHEMYWTIRVEWTSNHCN